MNLHETHYRIYFTIYDKLLSRVSDCRWKKIDNLVIIKSYTYFSINLHYWISYYTTMQLLVYLKIFLGNVIDSNFDTTVIIYYLIHFMSISCNNTYTKYVWSLLAAYLIDRRMRIYRMITYIIGEWVSLTTYCVFKIVRFISYCY